MIFHRVRLKQNNINISLRDIYLRRVTFTKLLGAIINILQMFKYFLNTLPEVIRELFITNDTFHFHNMKNKNNLCSKMSNRGYMYENFSFAGVYIRNDIQDDIPINTSYPTFKSNTKNYFQYNHIDYRIA